MTQCELITHFINRLRFRWNTAVSAPPELAAPPGNRPTYVSADPALSLTNTYSSLHMSSHTLTSTVRASTRSSFFRSLSPFLSFCRCFISQLGEYLNVIMTFAIKSKQRGPVWGVHARPPVFHADSAAACRVLFWLFWLFSASFQQMDWRF